MDLILRPIQSHQGVRPRVFRDRANPLTDSDENGDSRTIPSDEALFCRFTDNRGTGL